MAFLLDNNNTSNRKAICNYLEAERSSPGSGELTTVQEKLLMRWTFADDLLQSLKFDSNQIIDKLIDKFLISRTLATGDIADAQYVFGTLRPVNKRYLSSLIITDMLSEISRMKKIPSERKLLPRMYQSLADIVKNYPDDDDNANRKPTMITYNVLSLDGENVLELNSAMARVKKMMNIKHVTDLDLELVEEEELRTAEE